MLSLPLTAVQGPVQSTLHPSVNVIAPINDGTYIRDIPSVPRTREAINQSKLSYKCIAHPKLAIFAPILIRLKMNTENIVRLGRLVNRQ